MLDPVLDSEAIFLGARATYGLKITELTLQMLPEVWNSPIVQFLLARDELRFFPWRECALLRCFDYSKFESNFTIHEEWAGGKPQRQRWQLPRIISAYDRKNNKVVSKPRPFNVHDWSDWMTTLDEDSVPFVSSQRISAAGSG